jgi:protein TonB
VWLPFPARVPPHNELIALLEAEARDLSEAPTETPYTQKPVLLNRTQIEAAIIRVVHSVSPQVREMNELMARSQKIGGTTQMHIFIDPEGVVRTARLAKTSGNRDLDTAAENIVKMMRFSPAKNGDKAVGAWIEVPIRFRAN